jgi:hypothetical protein
MYYFNMFAEASSFTASDWQLIKGIAPAALLLLGAGLLSWVVEIINKFRR